LKNYKFLINSFLLFHLKFILRF